MTEFTGSPRGIGRSIHDAPERGASEIEDERIERILGEVTKFDLQRALIVLLSAARNVEGEALALEAALGDVVSANLKSSIESINTLLIEQGIDIVSEIIGSEALDILEADA